MTTPRASTLSMAVLSTVAAAAGLVHAQTPAGPEFRVNTSSTGEQSFPAVAADPRGNFVVVWQGTQPGAALGVLGQRFDSSGTPLGAEFTVPTSTTVEQGSPSVAVDARGNFVVVWVRGGPAFGIVARRFDATGAARGGELTLRAVNPGPVFPKVSTGPGGTFVVVWMMADGASYGIFGQRYDAAGTRVGAEFQANSYVVGNQGVPQVATDASGNFVVVWYSADQDGSFGGIFGQRFDANGGRRGQEFRVNTYTTLSQVEESVASDPLGNFVVAWASESDQDGAQDGVFAQRYDAAGSPLGGEFQVNTYTTAFQRDPSVAVDSTGGFVITWNSAPGQDGDLSGVFAQRYDPAGVRRGGEFRVNSFTPGHELNARVAGDAVGNAIVVWDGKYAGFIPTEVRGQRLGGIGPSALAVDPASGSGSDGNAVIEPGETAAVQPAWRNSTGSAQAPAGSIGAFTGPGGATYSVVDGAGLYALPDGDSTSCTDCYVLAVSKPASRPVLHWDAAFQEALTPSLPYGQVKPWALHVGDSFTDVARANPFYRFIETLLHNGVTGGCTATTYCPGMATTRDQMAVFVLAAKEGAGYAPPACTTPVFNDVPASSPFCRFIEELFRRGVVNGCGGGSFCPTAPVTREQMAVFTLRTLDPTLDPPACTTPVFNDVPASSPFCKWIEELVRRHVVAGCGGGNYCPGASVTREQMGVFIGATFGLTLYGP